MAEYAFHVIGRGRSCVCSCAGRCAKRRTRRWCKTRQDTDRDRDRGGSWWTGNREEGKSSLLGQGEPCGLRAESVAAEAAKGPATRARTAKEGSGRSGDCLGHAGEAGLENHID